MLKFIHAADLHLDSAFAALSPEKARQRRREGRFLVERLAELTRREGADALLISGDLFLTGESADCEQVVSPADAGSPYFYNNLHQTTFNYTIHALRIQDAARLMAVARRMAEAAEGNLTIWAEGMAARAVACALPLCDGVAEATLEAEALALDSDEAYYKDFFVPGICALGGLDACLKLADCPIKTF